MRGSVVKDHNGVEKILTVSDQKADGTEFERVLSSSVMVELSSCVDYVNEISELQQMCMDLGHHALFASKGHCELAGEGIEYDWGYSSKFKRRQHRDQDVHLLEDTLRSLSPSVLPLLRVRKYERTAWRYKQAYRRRKRGEATDGEEMEIQRLQKEIRRHRDAQVELSFIDGRRENPLQALEAPADTAAAPGLV